jgi:muramidase (phage lysozyme)
MSGGSKGIDGPGGNVGSAMGGAAGQSRAATVAQKNAFTQGKMAKDINDLASVAKEQLEHLRTNFERDRRFHEENQSAFTMVNKTLNRGFRALTTGTRFNPNNRGGSQGLGLGDLMMARMMGLGGGGTRMAATAGRMGLLTRLGLGGLAIGGLALGAHQVGQNQGESFLGTRQGEGGLMSSRASGYASNIAGGAAAGALAGSFIPVLGNIGGAIIGGLGGLITSVIEDKQLDIKSLIGNTWQGTVDFFKNIDWSNVGYDTGVFIRNMSIAIGETLGNMATAVGNWVKSINWSTVIQDSIRGIGSAIANTWNAAGDFITGAAAGASGGSRPEERRANGTVLQGQTMLNSGGTNIRAAEAGPEALLPLVRDRNGRLAVTMAGMNGGIPNPNANSSRRRDPIELEAAQINLTGKKIEITSRETNMLNEDGNPLAALGVPLAMNTAPRADNRRRGEARAQNPIEAVRETAANLQYGAVNQNLTPEARALLDTIASRESQGRYDVMYGNTESNPRLITDFSHHPNQGAEIMSGPNRGLTSTAAGRYQFINGTWTDIANRHNLRDFSPESQDMGAWLLAQEEYRRDTGRDLQRDLTDPSRRGAITESLRDQWTSLPRGIEQGRGNTQTEFDRTYEASLARQRGGASTPTTTPTATATPTPNANSMIQPAAWRGLVQATPPDVPSAPPVIRRPDPTLPPEMTTQRPAPAPVARPPQTSPNRPIDAIPFLTQSGLAVLTMRSFM